jgi:hypothetical protein
MDAFGAANPSKGVAEHILQLAALGVCNLNGLKSSGIRKAESRCLKRMIDSERT